MTVNKWDNVIQEHVVEDEFKRFQALIFQEAFRESEGIKNP